MQIPLKVNKKKFCDIKHGLTKSSYFQKPLHSFYTIPISIYGLQYYGIVRPLTKEKLKPWPPNFQKGLQISMLKKQIKICSRGLTHLDATPIVQIYMRHPVNLNKLI